MSSPPEPPPLPVITPFLTSLNAHTNTNAKDKPNYYVNAPQNLVTTSNIHTFTTGTGSSIFTSLTPLLLSTNQELILVTCFWARSASLQALNTVLRALSDKALQRDGPKIRIRICFSSLSIWQKLTHSQSLSGQTYPPSTWVKQFGLPPPEELQGLDLTIKSVFLWPFSVMHPKFAMVDRQSVGLMSCNVSWEPWFEGCITMSGAVVGSFLQFYREFWEGGAEMPMMDRNSDFRVSANGAGERVGETRPSGPSSMWKIHQEVRDSMRGLESPIPNACTEINFPALPFTTGIQTIFLPSPHHRNPRFQPFTRLSGTTAPQTPLNTFLLTLFTHAKRKIRIQTPNLTSPPVLSAILRALERGVDVEILTSERLMVLEQLGTAGTTTARCMNRLIRRYKRLTKKSENQTRAVVDEEAATGHARVGNLRIEYFQSATVQADHDAPHGDNVGEESVQSHIKLTIVDDEVLVLGSGNLDRASWFTSQELGVAFVDRGLASTVGAAVDKAMVGRRKAVFDARPSLHK